MSQPPLRFDELIAHVRNQHPDGDVLGQLSDAVRVSEWVEELADHLIGHFVDQARRAGASWTDIGRSLGVSKQAAQQRFVPRTGDEPSSLDAGVFGRFTPRARSALLVAQDEARRLGHDQVGTGHVLLGLLSEPQGLAAKAIEALGAGVSATREAVESGLGPAAIDVPAHIPFAARSKKALDVTVRTALRLGHNYVGTEHMLLGVLADEDDPSATALIAQGVTPDRTEEWITAALADLVAARKR